MPRSVSVVIPTFNRAAMLREAINSVLSQRDVGLADLEIVVVDDGSTDSTRGMLQAAYAGDERIRYHYQRNAGASAARNAGLDLAGGDAIAFIDSDDTWQPWHLALQLAALERHPDVGFVWSNLDAVDGHGAIVASSAASTLLSAYRSFTLDELFTKSTPLPELGVELPSEYVDQRLYIGDIYSAMIMGNLVWPSSVVMRRTLLDRVGRFDEALVRGEDHEFFLRASREAIAGFADVPSIRYRVGMVDQRTSPEDGLAIARAYLNILDTALAGDAGRITLSPSQIREARAHAYEWLGEMEVHSGLVVDARKHLAAAIRIRRRPRTLAALAASMVPPRVLRLVVVAVRRATRRATRLLSSTGPAASPAAAESQGRGD
jgi:glycosyltransferase involved in cell wall biosynthesis